MAYVGNSYITQGFTPGIDYFNGNGSTLSFTLSRPVASATQVEVYVENVPQNPSAAFVVSSNTITFTSAPPSGTNNIYVRYVNPITQVFAPSIGTVGTAQISNALVFYENAQTLVASYTITSGKSAMSTGPITLNSGVAVTIPSGSRWVVL